MNRQLKDSIVLGFDIVTGFATVCTVLGFSMRDAFPFNTCDTGLAVIARLFILSCIYLLVSFVIWLFKGYKYKNKIELKVGNNDVTIRKGDIFKENAWRVIPVDSRVETRVDDRIISKNSLQGKLIQKYNDIEGIMAAVENEAINLNVKKVDKESNYSFEYGTVIPYRNKDDKYLLVVINKLDKSFLACTTLAQYEITLLTMWDEISKVYEGFDVSLPIIGNGITRFVDGRDDTGNLLRCMLCTLNTSGVHLQSRITIILYEEDNKKLPLYEYKDIYNVVNWETYSD